MDGILLIDKPSGITSHDAVDYIRKKAGIKRVGHTGTLDPNATGLLILCLGKATRLSEYFISLDKIYEGRMRLGIVTDSHDIDGNVIKENEVKNITKKEVKRFLSEFIGDIEQIPPMISAIRIGGKRLYKMAREGLEIERKPRKVKIYEFTLLDMKLPDIWFRVACSRGTYVRTLCHDLGERMGCGATLIELKRTQVGNYKLENAIPLNSLTTKEEIQKNLIPIEKALDLPQIVVNASGEFLFTHGNKIKNENILKIENEGTNDLVQVFNQNGVFLGIASLKRTAVGPFLTPKKVFI